MPNVDDSHDMSQVKYVLIFLVDKDSSYASEEIVTVEDGLFNSLILIWLVICSGFVIVLFIIMLDVFLTARKIQKTILFIRDKTNQLKKANDV